MKHLKLFENFGDIATICKKYAIENYTINSDGSVDVDGNVDLFDKKLVKLPIKFGKVTGSFDCSYNQLTSLEGGPKEVGDYFDCTHNQLTSLESGPKKVGGSFDCSCNQLTSLEGGPKEVGGYFYFYCRNNQLTSLEGGPREVGGSFDCSYNQLTSLEGGPKEVGADFNCSNNPISKIYQLFGTYKKFRDSLDYNYLRGNDIVKSRFEEALGEIGKPVPKKIPGYNYI